ncbi:hypothetical protein NPIL_432671 [Nephila pilipes]|uniref:Uncharacterized protein n=1 Tax=Nephila pilipes TaxID=299642 RepID=A0A8X6NF23_NEPPI|nr:hypothetical protein NPIL_432671 [Nephila pilipes]
MQNSIEINFIQELYETTYRVSSTSDKNFFPQRQPNLKLTRSAIPRYFLLNRNGDDSDDVVDKDGCIGFRRQYSAIHLKPLAAELFASEVNGDVLLCFNSVARG